MLKFLIILIKADLTVITAGNLVTIDRNKLQIVVSGGDVTVHNTIKHYR